MKNMGDLPTYSGTVLFVVNQQHLFPKFVDSYPLDARGGGGTGPCMDAAGAHPAHQGTEVAFQRRNALRKHGAEEADGGCAKSHRKVEGAGVGADKHSGACEDGQEFTKVGGFGKEMRIG